MGVISITQRSESLGNIHSAGTPRRASSTDIGTVHRAGRAVYTPIYREKRSHDGDDALVRGLSKLGDAGRAMVDLSVQIQDREDNRQADLISQAVMSNVDRMDRDDSDIDDWDAPDRKHLEGQKRGLLLRTGEGCRDLPKEADDLYGNTFKQIADSLNATEKQRQMAAERLYGYRRARQNRMMDLQASEYRKTELGNAAGNFKEYVTQWKNGNSGVLEDIFRAHERLGVLKGDTAAMRKAGSGELAVELAADLVRNKLNGCATDEDFDMLEGAVRKGPEEFMPVEIASRLPDGKIGGKTQEALLDEIKREKRIFRAERDAKEREAKQAVGRDFTERELKIRNMPQELWAEVYDAMGRDKILQKADPKRAMAYIDAANEMRSAMSKAKEKASADAIKANEEGLARSLATLDLLKMDGSLSQDDANEAQAAIWRKFRTLSLGNQISTSFMQSFRNRLSGQLSDQEAAAMRKFYGLLGFHGELTGKGDVTAAAKRDAESTYKTVDGLKFDDVEMFDMGDEILRRLRGMGPEIDRQGALDEVVKDVFSKALSKKMDAEDVRDAIVSGLGEYEDRFSARQPNGGKDGDGKDGE